MNNISEHLGEGVLTIFINGNFDESTSIAIEEKFKECFSRADILNICIDLRNVRYLSSAGIKVLIIAHKKGVKSDKKVRLGEISLKAKDVLDTVGILPLFDMPGRV